MTDKRPTPLMLAILVEMSETGLPIAWDYRRGHDTYWLGDRRLFRSTVAGLRRRRLFEWVSGREQGRFTYALTEAGRAAADAGTGGLRR